MTNMSPEQQWGVVTRCRGWHWEWGWTQQGDAPVGLWGSPCYLLQQGRGGHTKPGSGPERARLGCGVPPPDVDYHSSSLASQSLDLSFSDDLVLAYLWHSFCCYAFSSLKTATTPHKFSSVLFSLLLYLSFQNILSSPPTPTILQPTIADNLLILTSFHIAFQYLQIKTHRNQSPDSLLYSSDSLEILWLHHCAWHNPSPV